MGDAGLWLETHALENLRNLGRSIELAVAQFRVLVEPAAPFDHLGLNVRAQLVQLGRCNLGLHG
jgi:hypothetical protein